MRWATLLIITSPMWAQYYPGGSGGSGLSGATPRCILVALTATTFGCAEPTSQIDVSGNGSVKGSWQTGNAGGTNGKVTLAGATSGAASIVAQATQGTPADVQLPTTTASATPLLTGSAVGAQIMVVGGDGARSMASAGGFQVYASGFQSLGNPTPSTFARYTGGQDANFNTAIGPGLFEGGDAGSGGGASSNGGPVRLKGGACTVASATCPAGSVQIMAGRADGSTQGLQGLAQWLQTYIKGTTVTQFNLFCPDATTSNKGADCGASPTNWIGVAENVNSNTVQVALVPSLVPINASAAVTLGHTVCAGATAGKVTDSGGVGACTLGTTVGIVVATSGTWPAASQADGLTFTASTTLPLIQMQRE